MSSPRAEFFRSSRAARWLLPAALLVLMPKCLLCVLAYAGLGTALGLGGPEICGAPGASTWTWPPWLAAIGAALGAIALVAGYVRVTRH